MLRKECMKKSIRRQKKAIPFGTAIFKGQGLIYKLITWQ